MTPREIEERRDAILRECAAGASPEAVAEAFGVSVLTVNRYLRSIPWEVAVDITAVLLPVFPVRLAGKPGPGAGLEPCPLCHGRGYVNDRTCAGCDGAGFKLEEGSDGR